MEEGPSISKPWSKLIVVNCIELIFTHTHTHIYIYICMYASVCVGIYIYTQLCTHM